MLIIFDKNLKIDILWVNDEEIDKYKSENYEIYEFPSDEEYDVATYRYKFIKENDDNVYVEKKLKEDKSLVKKINLKRVF